MNPLQQIPPAVRKWLYLAYAIVGLVLGGFQVAGQDTIADVSVIKCLAVLAYVGTALGFTAASNAGDSRTVAVTAPENAPTTVTADVKFDGDPGRLGAQISEHLRDYKRHGGHVD